MSGNKIVMTKEAIRAQIDVCGHSVAYIANNANGVVSDETMWSLNQAIIALQHALRKLGEEKECES